MNTLITNKNHLIKASFIFTIFAICIAIYSQGLKGPLLLDSTKIYQLEEVYNIKKLAPSLTDISFSGYAKRIVSQTSFYLNIAYDHKVNPFHIKLTNLVIHLICGFLIFILTSKIVRLSSYKENHTTISLMVFSLWLLSPVNMSSVLYGIQRMNQLSALFSLLSCITYITFRQQQIKNDLRTITVLFNVSLIALLALLALFSKENAITLILFFLLLETFFFKKKPLDSRLLKGIFFATFVVFILLVAFSSDTFISLFNYESRPFSMLERLMTQARIVCLYILKIVLPYSTATELFHDSYPISKNLLYPITTTVSILSIITLSFLCYRLTKHERFTIFSFGIAFFFVGHLLESTILPLELYYEHRNYLPSLGIYLAISTLVITALKKADNGVTKAFILLYLSLFICTGFFKASTWSNPETAYLKAVERHYISARAASNLSHIYFQRNDFSEAKKLLDKVIKTQPHEALRARLQLIYMHCIVNANIHNNVYNQLAILSTKESTIEISQALNNINTLIQQNNCPSLDTQKFTTSLEQISSSLKQHKKDSWGVDYYIAQIYLKNKNHRSLIELLMSRLNAGDIRSGQYLRYLASENTAIPISPEIQKRLNLLER